MLVSTINRYRIKFREVQRPTDHHQSLTDLGAAGVNIGNHDDSLYCQVYNATVICVTSIYHACVIFLRGL